MAGFAHGQFLKSLAERNRPNHMPPGFGLRVDVAGAKKDDPLHSAHRLLLLKLRHFDRRAAVDRRILVELEFDNGQVFTGICGKYDAVAAPFDLLERYGFHLAIVRTSTIASECVTYAQTHSLARRACILASIGQYQ